MSWSVPPQAASCTRTEGLIPNDRPKGGTHQSGRAHGDAPRRRSKDRGKGLIMKMVTKVVALLAGLATALLLSVGFASTATAKPRPALDPPPVPVAGTLAGGTVNEI